MIIPTTLNEAEQLERTQSTGKTKCLRHIWRYDGACAPCAVEHFGGTPIIPGDPRFPNTFTPFVVAPAPRAAPTAPGFVLPRDAAEAYDLADWQYTKFGVPSSAPRCGRHLMASGFKWPYKEGTVCGQCACEHYGAEYLIPPNMARITTNAVVPNMFTSRGIGAPAALGTDPADAKQPDPSWRAWQHNVPGECACGIPRSACTYHFAPSLRPLSPEARERQALRERLEALR